MKRLVPTHGNVSVLVREPAAHRSPLPVSVDILTPKRNYTVQLQNIQRFVQENLEVIQEKLDGLGIPIFSLQDIKDDTRGPGAGLMTCNEHLFPFPAQQAWMEETLAHREPEEVKNTLESCGLAFQVLANFSAAGGQRVPEIESISLMETAANQKKGVNFQQGVQAFLLSDYSKPEGKHTETLNLRLIVQL